MNRKRVMIAAPKSGSGKTMAACALLQALKMKGWQVSSFKCGPDYIDPMFHEKAIHVPARNLDTFFTGEEGTKELFCHGIERTDFAVLEGVMGLYDGLGGVREEGSSYHLAKVTQTPIVLIVDAKGMGKSILPLIAGFLAYDKERLIRGVILNKISKGYYEIIKPLIEEELNIQAVGFLPEKKECQIESRHLGLFLPDELHDIQTKLQLAAEEFLKTVSLETIIEIAGSAEEFMVREQVRRREPERAVIAVARDEAFCFYYRDNLRILEESGGRITFFSPLHDEKLPEGCHALLLGGGYPELYAKELSENHRMRAAVKRAADSGMPVLAECGGFLYLHSALKDKEGNCYDMADVVSGTCFYTGKLVRFGYIELLEKQSCFLPEGDRIKGHEFHYYDSTNNGADIIARKPVTGKEYSCMIEKENCCMGFPHLYYPSNPLFAQSFVEKAERYKEGRKMHI
ncbi:MAG: cobyrinate a,c-diamide synthase [Lachnospiraceae bacterium]|nr:cobyrinate a,c-diamide synthase [Lachnospiraceae bacterium]